MEDLKQNKFYKEKLLDYDKEEIIYSQNYCSHKLSIVQKQNKSYIKAFYQIDKDQFLEDIPDIQKFLDSQKTNEYYLEFKYFTLFEGTYDELHLPLVEITYIFKNFGLNLPNLYDQIEIWKSHQKLSIPESRELFKQLIKIHKKYCQNTKKLLLENQFFIEVFHQEKQKQQNKTPEMGKDISLEKKLQVKILPIFHIQDYDSGEMIEKNYGYAQSPEIVFRKFSNSIEDYEFFNIFSYGKHSVYFSSAIAIRLVHGKTPVQISQRIQGVNEEDEQNPFIHSSGLSDLKYFQILKKLYQEIKGEQKFEQYIEILRKGILFSHKERLALSFVMDQLKLRKNDEEEKQKITCEQYRKTNQIIKDQQSIIKNSENRDTIVDADKEIHELQEKNLMQQNILKQLQQIALKDVHLQELLNEAVSKVGGNQPELESSMTNMASSEATVKEEEKSFQSPLPMKERSNTIFTKSATPDVSKKARISKIDDMKNVTNLIKEMNRGGQLKLGTIIEAEDEKAKRKKSEKPFEYNVTRTLQYKASLGTNTIIALNREYVAEAGDNKEIKIWEWETGNIPIILTGHSQEINTLCILMHNIIASGSNSIKIWDTVTGLCLKTLTTLETKFTQIIKLDSEYIASSALDCKIRIFQWKKNQLIHTLSGHQMPVLSLCRVSDARIASGSDDCCLRIWNWKTNQCEKIELLHSSYINKMILVKEEENIIATGNGDGTVKIIDYENIKTIFTFDKHLGEVTALVYIKAENRLVSGGQDSSVIFYDLNTNTVLQIIEDVGTMITCLTYFKKGKSGEYSILTGGACDALNEITKLEQTTKQNLGTPSPIMAGIRSTSNSSRIYNNQSHMKQHFGNSKIKNKQISNNSIEEQSNENTVSYQFNDYNTSQNSNYTELEVGDQLKPNSNITNSNTNPNSTPNSNK